MNLGGLTINEYKPHAECIIENVHVDSERQLITFTKETKIVGEMTLEPGWIIFGREIGHDD